MPALSQVSSGSFDDEGGPFLVELVGVEVEPAPGRFLEGEGEGVELLLRPEPDEAALAHVDARIEVALVLAARGRIDAVGTDHQVVFLRIVVGVLEFGGELQLDAEFQRPRLEDLQQLQAPDAAEAVPARNDATVLEEDVDVVPMVEIALDFSDHARIVMAEAVHGLVGKHDAPAEGAVRLVALDHGDVACRIGLLHQDREVQAGGSPAQTYDAHQTSLFRPTRACLYILYLN
jgi:hypothetical protein